MPEFFALPVIEKPNANEVDIRLEDLIDTESTLGDRSDIRCAIVGFPSDAGVARNGGRPGAAKGPDIIRSQLFRLTPDARQREAFKAVCRATLDLGNISCSGEVAEDQLVLGKLIGGLIEQDIVPIILGGGHETSFGHFLGYVHAARPVTIINIDAHPDVRPLHDGFAHSGSPFHQALEHGSDCCEGYVVAGLYPATVAAPHVDYVLKQGGQFYWKDEVDADLLKYLFDDPETSTMATFDLDAVDQAYAPGVSAPNFSGLTAKMWLQACLEAGRSRAVTSFDLVEFNPLFDSDNRTARLAAGSVWWFLAGLADRLSLPATE